MMHYKNTVLSVYLCKLSAIDANKHTYKKPIWNQGIISNQVFRCFQSLTSLAI